MRRLHLKLFYLRTRVKREPQGVTAKLLGVRPATMSHLEQGRSIPTLQMLVMLCKHYDVTPTYLLDDERPIELKTRDRWSERNAIVSRGDWLEVPEASAVRTRDASLLCPVLGGARFYNVSAQAQRLACTNAEEVTRLELQLVQSARKTDNELEQILMRELLAQRKPRHNGRAVSLTESGRAMRVALEH